MYLCGWKTLAGTVMRNEVRSLQMKIKNSDKRVSTIQTTQRRDWKGRDTWWEDNLWKVGKSIREPALQSKTAFPPLVVLVGSKKCMLVQSWSFSTYRGQDDYLSPTCHGRNRARSFRAESTNPKSSIFFSQYRWRFKPVEENNQPNRYQHLE